MTGHIALIGFGEAAMTFAASRRWGREVRAFDVKTLEAGTADVMRSAYRSHGIIEAGDTGSAVAGADVVLSLVTADQSLAAAHEASSYLKEGALWFDMNSVSPNRKKAAAEIIASARARHVDVAIMAPVEPGRFAVPLLLAGPSAMQGIGALAMLGFSNITVAGSRTGDAAAIKMIRSVMIKGLEALTAECALAAERADVSDALFASLDSTWTEQGWEARADYNLDRMLAHGGRRAAEMEEAARTLEELRVEAAMTRGTIARQRALGALAIDPPQGLAAKLAAITRRYKDQAI